MCYPKGRLQFSLIDTARARFRMRRFPLSKRIADMNRLCSKLDAERQEQFMSAYLEGTGVTFGPRLTIFFQLYIFKAWLKRWKRKVRKLLTK